MSCDRLVQANVINSTSEIDHCRTRLKGSNRNFGVVRLDRHHDLVINQCPNYWQQRVNLSSNVNHVGIRACRLSSDIYHCRTLDGHATRPVYRSIKIVDDALAVRGIA